MFPQKSSKKFKKRKLIKVTSRTHWPLIKDSSGTQINNNINNNKNNNNNNNLII